jgi:hypothetical protein
MYPLHIPRPVLLLLSRSKQSEKCGAGTDTWQYQCQYRICMDLYEWDPALTYSMLERSGGATYQPSAPQALSPPLDTSHAPAPTVVPQIPDPRLGRLACPPQSTWFLGQMRK